MLHVQECVELSWMEEDNDNEPAEVDQPARTEPTNDISDKDLPSLKRPPDSSSSQDQQELCVRDEPEQLCKRMRCEKA